MRHHATSRTTIQCLLAIALAAAGATTAVAQPYTIVDLGSLHGWTHARALSDNQLVVGSSVADNWQYRGFVWRSGLTPIPPPPPFTQTEAMDVNALARAIYAAYSMGDVGARALLLDNTQATDLGAFVPRAINAAGHVVGAAEAVNTDGLVATSAVLYNGATLTTLPTLPGGGDAIALDIADTGDIVGSAFASNSPTPSAVLWRASTITTLGPISGTFSQATAISHDGAYVCGLTSTAASTRHAFRYRLVAGAVTQRLDLGTLSASPNAWSVAYDVAADGRVVGTSDGHAFLYTGSAMVDLNTLTIPDPHWTLIGATGINALGDIVGWGAHDTLGLRAFLLAHPCSDADIAAPLGVLNTQDFFHYLNQYVAGNLAVADLTTTAVPGLPGYGIPNGIINSDDFFYFLALYAVGC